MEQKVVREETSCVTIAKKKGHNMEKCWILHPNLKPLKFRAVWELSDGSAIGAAQKNH